MLKAVGNDPEREGLDTGGGLDLRGAVGHHARKIGDLSDPAPVGFPLNLDGVRHDVRLAAVTLAWEEARLLAS